MPTQTGSASVCTDVPSRLRRSARACAERPAGIKSGTIPNEFASSRCTCAGSWEIGSSWRGSPTTTARLERQRAPTAACGSAWPASSMSSQPSSSFPRGPNIRPVDANVVDSTGMRKKRVCQAARSASFTVVRPGSRVRSLHSSTSVSRTSRALASMQARCRSRAARKTSVLACIHFSSDQGAARSWSSCVSRCQVSGYACGQSRLASSCRLASPRRRCSSSSRRSRASVALAAAAVTAAPAARTLARTARMEASRLSPSAASASASCCHCRTCSLASRRAVLPGLASSCARDSWLSAACWS